MLRDTPLNEAQLSLLENLRECSDSLLLVVNDTLDFSKIEAGALELEYKPFDICKCVRGAIYVAGMKGREKGIDVGFKIDGIGQGGTITLSSTDEEVAKSAVPKFICGDPARLKQILINLVGNACKFTQKGHVRLLVSVDSCNSKTGEYSLTFQVQDTGIGIPQEAMSRLFKPFSQVDSSTSRKFGGSGLGLAICHRYIELMKGEICVSSELGRGSIFSFQIKTIATGPPSGSFEEIQNDLVNFLPKELGLHYPMRILLAEDNPLNVKVGLKILEKMGYHDVTVAVNGEEAVALFAVSVKHGEPVDLILMDVQVRILPSELRDIGHCKLMNNRCLSCLESTLLNLFGPPTPKHISHTFLHLPQTSSKKTSATASKSGWTISAESPLSLSV